MAGLLLVGMIALIALVALSGAWLILSTLNDPPEDTQGRVTKVSNSNRSRSWIGRFKGWLNQTPPKLYYRRDKRGRFRKVWRG